MKEIRNNIIETNKCKKFIENITISPFKSTVLNNYSNYSTILDNLNKVVEKQKYSTITLTFDNREQTSEKLILYKLIDHDYFNSLEFKRLTELLSASKTYFHPISQNILSITNQELYIQLMFFKWECDVENITNFSKVLTSFDRICDNDRLALVKYACYDMMSMRHMHYYNQEKEYWTLHLVSFILWVLYSSDHDLVYLKIYNFKNVSEQFRINFNSGELNNYLTPLTFLLKIAKL